MSKKVPLYLVLILVVLSALIAFNATFLYFNEKYNQKLNETLAGYSYFDELLGIDAVVRKNYIGKIDETELKNTILRGYLSGTGDKYAAYMTSDEYESFMDQQSGSSVAIGVTVTYDSGRNAIEIVSIYPESPAEESGLQVGDLIIEANGKKVSEIGYYSALDEIKGAVGTTVSLTVERGGSELSINCERRETTVPSVSYRVYSYDSSVGIISLNEFISTTPGEVKTAVTALMGEGCDKLVFDLRNNPGGDLNSIISVLDYLLPQGPITHIYYNNGKESHYDSDASHIDAKFAVIVNGNTASAAELFTAALKDYAAQDKISAVVVGTKTYGKGVLQSFYQLKNGAAFKITTGRYDPPYSENYDGFGVLPDVVSELSEEAAAVNFYKLTDSIDNQLETAVGLLNKQ